MEQNHLNMINSLVSLVIFLLFPLVLIWTLLEYGFTQLFQVGVCLTTSFLYFTITILLSGFLLKLFEKTFYKGSKIIAWFIFFTASIFFSMIYLYNMIANFLAIYTPEITSILYVILSAFFTISFSSFLISAYFKDNKFIGVLVDVNNISMVVSIILSLFIDISILKICFSTLVFILLVTEAYHISKNSDYHDYPIQEYDNKYK